MLTKEQLPLAGRIDMQRARIRRMDYTVIGKIATLVLDADRDANLPMNEVPYLGRRISFTGNSPGGRSVLYPVGLSLDQQELLLPNGLPKVLPSIPRPDWQGRLTIEEKTPWVLQLYEDRASGRTNVLDTEWMVFRPVHQLLMVSVGYFKGINWPKILFRSDFNGDHAVLLFQPLTGEAHIIGGRFEPNTHQVFNDDVPNVFAAP